MAIKKKKLSRDDANRSAAGWYAFAGYGNINGLWQDYLKKGFG